MNIQPSEAQGSRVKGLLIYWLAVIVVGFIGFVLPQIPFQIGLFGEYAGINLTIIAVLQALLVIPLLYWGLRRLNLSFASIGWTKRAWLRDSWLGVLVAGCWAIVQFVWLIPNTGGAERADIVAIVSMLEGHWSHVLWYLPLGIIGGGLTEELYNRGFIIGVIACLFHRSKWATGIAAVIAIVFFAAGHLPTNAVEWIDLLVPSTAYTLLYVATGRLTAPIIAHGLWNSFAAIGIYLLYV